MEPLLHIGYAKTGSTFLQFNIFKPDYGFYNAFDQHFAQVIQRFILCNSFTYDAVATLKYFKDKYAVAKSQGLKPVISAESLSGQLFANNNIEKAISLRLKETFPDAKILIVIRNQKAIIKSAWKHYLRNNGAQTIDRFIRKEGIKQGFTSILNMDRFQYHFLVKQYQKLYGKENVLVLPFELLKINQKEYVNKILAFSGTCKEFKEDIYPPANVARTPVELFIRHKIGFYMNVDRYGDKKVFLQKVLDKVCPLVAKITPDCVNKSIDKSWDRYLDLLIDGYYQDSNNILAEITGLDLKEYHYEI